MSYKIDNPYCWPIVIPDTAFGNMSNAGVIAQAIYDFNGAQPNPGDNVVIGAKQYDFVGALIAPYGNTQILIGAGVNNTGLSLQHAINGTADASVVVAVGYVPYNLVSSFSNIAKQLLIANAVSPGGALVAGTQPLLLSASSTTGAAWDVVGLDATGRAATSLNFSAQKFTVEAEMIAAGGFAVRMTSFGFIWQVIRSGNVYVPISDTLSPIPGRLVLSLGGADIQAGDVVTIISFGA